MPIKFSGLNYDDCDNDDGIKQKKWGRKRRIISNTKHIQFDKHEMAGCNGRKKKKKKTFSFGALNWRTKTL